MKKMFIIILAVLTMFSICLLSACDSSGNENGGGGGSSSAHIYDDSPHADKWDSNQYGSSAYGVWDSYVLPDFFPAQPTEGAIEDVVTYYRSETDELMSSVVRIGKMSFEKGVERFSVVFYGQDAHLAYLQSELEEKGFIVGEEYTYSNSESGEVLTGLHCFTKDWYVYIGTHIRYGDYTGDYPRYFDITMIKKQYAYPASFCSVTLPQNAFITYEMTYDVWDEVNEEYVYYPVTRTPQTGEIWGIYEMEFWAMELDDYQNYKTQTEAAGWTITGTSEPGEYSDRYRFHANKDGVYLIVDFDVTDNCIVLGASNDENYWG